MPGTGKDGRTGADKRAYARMVDRMMRENDAEEEALLRAAKLERRAERFARKNK